MNIGSRPIERIARTGEFTPPGSTRSARRYSSADRVSVREAVTGGRSGVLAFPLAERVGEVEHPDLLELRARVERRALRDPGGLRDRVEDRVALLLRAA